MNKYTERMNKTVVLLHKTGRRKQLYIIKRTKGCTNAFERLTYFASGCIIRCIKYKTLGGNSHEQGKHQEGRSGLLRRFGYIHHHPLAEGKLQ